MLFLRRVAGPTIEDPEYRYERWKLRAKYGFLISGAVIFILAGLLIPQRESAREAPKYLELLSGFLTELGIAFIVAVVVAGTVEHFSRAEFRRIARFDKDAVAQDVFKYVYGYHIPPQIRAEINDQVLTEKFVRDSIQLVYTLTPEIRAGNSRWMQVNLDVTYQVRNIGNRPRNYDLRAVLELPGVPELDNLTQFASISVEGSTVPLDRLDGDQLKKYVRSDALSRVLTPPQPEVQPATPMIVRVGYNGYCHQDGGFDFFTYKDHTCETEVVALMQDSSYSVTARNFGGEPLVPVPVTHHPESGHYHWICATPILKYQGIILAWCPRPGSKG